NRPVRRSAGFLIPDAEFLARVVVIVSWWRSSGTIGYVIAPLALPTTATNFSGVVNKRSYGHDRRYGNNLERRTERADAGRAGRRRRRRLLGGGVPCFGCCWRCSSEGSPSVEPLTFHRGKTRTGVITRAG